MKSRYEELNINIIELDIENPRIKMYLEQYHEVTAEGIALALNSSANDGTTSFISLKESIRVNKGIIHPIVVNQQLDGKYVVIEGNTRLQIYKDFSISNPDGPWKTIRCIVYDNLSKEEIHAIRLQSHLVGPRDWDPYSKAKYLDQLSNVEKLPMEVIVSMCGGKKGEIIKLINAYSDMTKYYFPQIEKEDYDFDHKDFSKFAELQNRSIIDALMSSGYTKVDFTSWVINKNIDTAQNVRLLPQILKDKAAKQEFLKTNISNAIKKLNISTATNIDLTAVSYEDLCQALSTKLRKIEFREAMEIINESTDKGRNRRALLLGVIDDIKDILTDDED